MFRKGSSCDIACAKPRVVMASWLWIYSKKVVLVQRPALCISNVLRRLIYKAIAPPVRNECEPTLSLENLDFLSSSNAGMASCTSFTISLLRTNCHGNDFASRKAQIKVSGDAPSRKRSIIRATTARTGQHGLPLFRA